MMDSDIKKDFSKNIMNFLNKIQVLLFKLNSGSELLPKDIKSLEFLKYVIKVENEYTKSDATDFSVDVSDDEVDNTYMIVPEEEESKPPRIKFDTTTEEAQKLIEVFNLDNLEEDSPEENDLPPLDLEPLKKDADDITKEHLELINYKKHICWFNTIKTPLKEEFEKIIREKKEEKESEQSESNSESESIDKVRTGIIKPLDTPRVNSIPLSA